VTINDGTYGEVDLGRDNHKHHPHGEDAGDGGLAQQVRDVARAQIRAVGHPGKEEHDCHDGGNHDKDLEIERF